MEGKQTTGAVVSRLAVLHVLAENLIKENRLAGDARRKARGEVQEILGGEAGVPSEKIATRLLERCVAGGAGIQVGPNDFGFVGIGGQN
jgi:hypothetical protein